MKSNDTIQNLSIEFALDVMSFCENLDNMGKYVISKQLLRSGTSIGANIHEAQSPESKNDFIHKLKIAHKEAMETMYWLILCENSKNYPTTLTLQSKLKTLLNILNRILYTANKQN